MKKQAKNLLLAMLVMVLAFGGATSAAAEENVRKAGLKAFEVERTLIEDKNEITFEVYSNSNYDINYWTRFSNRYYYNLLSQEEKLVWDELESACIAFVSGNETGSTIDVACDGASLGWTAERVTNFLMRFKYTNPQYYFLDSRVGYSYMGNGEIIGASIYVYPAFQDGAARAVATNQFTNKVNAWVQQVAVGARPEDKLKIAHDLIASNTIYSFGTYDQSAYSMVCEGATVCAGYTAALQLLLNPNGVEAVEVTSYDHAWNLVNLHGNWYNVDVTWDDTDFSVGEPQAYYDCYLKSDATLIANDGFGSHTTESYWNGVAPVGIYDSTSSEWEEYCSSYFMEGDYTYFMVNDNTERGNRMAAVVESLNGALESNAPATVEYDGNTYAVLKNIQETPDEESDGTSTGVPATPANGLCSSDDGNWYYWADGKIDTSYTGLYCDANVGWWLVRNGKVAFDYTGLYCDEVYGWWLIGGGRVCFEYTGLWGDPQYGWWLVNGGTIPFDYTGLYYDANCGWWLVGGGRVCFEYTGLWGDSQYGWWLVNGGTIPFDYTGLYYDTNCGWWYIQNGAVGFGYTGEVYYEGVPYYVVNGQLV